jgi:hypothetical protein
VDCIVWSKLRIYGGVAQGAPLILDSIALHRDMRAGRQKWLDKEERHAKNQARRVAVKPCEGNGYTAAHK